MSGHCRITPDGSPSGLVSELAGEFAPAIGRIETLVGLCTVSRSGGPAAAIKIGDLVGPSDVIETSAGGRLSIRFSDGTTFTLSDNARMALKEYLANDASALFDVSRGTFSFIAGKMAEAGRSFIQTPFANIRAHRNGGGTGMLSLVSLFFAAFEEAHAASSDVAFLDDGKITSKDLGQFGIVELLIKATATTPEQTKFLDDPGETIVIRATGSSVSVDSVTNSIAQMAQYQAAQQEALHTFSVGLQGQGPTGNGGSGSSTLLPPEFTPPPQNINFVPNNPPPILILPPPGTTQQNNNSDPPLQGPPPPPPPPPSETIDAAIGTNTGITATITSGGLTKDNTLTVTGTVTSSNLSSVSIHVFDGSVDLGPATIDGSGNWSLTTNPLPDGLHTFTAVATNNSNPPITAGPVTAIVDTLPPTVAVNIVDASLSDTDNNSVVTFTFSEKVSDATVAGLASGAGITVTGGTLSALTWNPGHTAATATFTATDGNETTGSVTVDANSYTDVAGNLGSSGTDSVPIDTKNPTVAVNIVDASLSDTDNNSVVTFTFSEVPVNFDASDITASHGTISGLTKNLALDPSGKTYTATFTAQSGFFGTGSVSVGTAWQDSAGNTGGSGSDTVAIDTDSDLTGALSGLTGNNAVEEQTVQVNTLSDGGINIIGDTTHVTYSWQVFRNGVWYQEGNHRSFNPSAADLGLQLRVVVSYVEQEAGESGTETIILPAGTVQDEANGAAGFADATGNGNWQTSNKWSSNQVPGASTNVELNGNGGFQIAVNDVRSANSLYISGSGNSVVLNGASTPGLNVAGAVTVLNGGLLDLSANGAALMAGSITGTITVDNNAVITGSSGSTIVGPSGTGPWAEIITSATIFVANSGKTVSGPSPGVGGLAIDSGATLTLTGGTHAENILFANNFPDNHLDSGTLVISGGTAFTGLVYGFAAGGGFSDIIDLKSISFDAGTTWAYTDNIGFNTGGTLAIFENGIKETSIAFGNGEYITANFKLTSDGGGGMFIADPPATNDSAASATAETSLTTNTDTVSFVSGTNQVLATDLTATNGDMIIGGSGSDTLTIDTGPGANHTFVFGDGGNGHSDIGLAKFENLTLTDIHADANDQDSITVTFDSNFQNDGALTVDGSALHELNGTNLTIDAHLATHDSFILIGSNAADTLTGGSHGDIIVGNGGGDTLTGGGGSDTFLFKTLTDSQPGVRHFDTITDFAHNSDHIDLTAIAGATVVQGNVATINTVDAHSISWFVDNPNNQTVVYVNTTGVANHVDMEIHLTGTNINLAESDILHHT